jgi:methyl-accepting chemotaxis protein
MNTAEWILVAFLSVALLIFLVVSTILVIKLIGLTKDVRGVVATGQKIVDNVEDVTDDAADIAKNVKNMTTVSGVIKSVTDAYNEFTKKKGRSK